MTIHYRSATLLLIAAALYLYAPCSKGQGLFERVPDSIAKQAVFLFGYDNTSNGVRIVSTGTGSLYVSPVDDSSPEPKGAATIVTARHVLYHKIDQRCMFDATNLLDGLIAKFSAVSGSTSAVFLKIPLKKDIPHNFWISDRGGDLAVVPFPLDKVGTTANPTFREYQVVTPERVAERHIAPGLVVAAICFQPEYFEPIDFFLPETTPIVRMGHLSRLGWTVAPDGTSITRDHVIDLHTSPGNSGSTVIIWTVTDDGIHNLPMFLGVISSFRDEKDAHSLYNAPITNVTLNSIALLNSDTGHTNLVALSTFTPSNPDLSSVVPVDELVGLLSRKTFLEALALMIANESRYERLTAPGIMSLLEKKTEQMNP